MKDLRLNQRIYVTTTCYVCDQLFKLERTTVSDVLTRNNKVDVVLGNGHFGACPTRQRNQVVGNIEELRAVFESEIDTKAESVKSVYGVSITPTQISISKYKFHETRESLANGKESIYYGINRFSGGARMVVRNDELPKGYFFNIEDAYNEFAKLIENDLT